MNVQRLCWSEFEARGEAWDRLLLASPGASPFLCRAWLETWWRHFGGDQEFVALLVNDDAGEPAAGVPLAFRRVRWPIGSRTVAEIVGTGPVPTRGMGLADSADLIVRGDATAAGTVLAEALAEMLDRVDVVDLKGIDTTEGVPPITKGLAGSRTNLQVMDRSVSPYLPLPSTWDEYLSSRSGNFRKHLRKYWRQLEKSGPVECERVDTADRCRECLPEMIAVDEDSWKAERGTNLFAHARIRAFLEDLLAAMARDGWLDLHLLRVDGALVAYELCFDVAGRVFSYNSSFRRDWRNRSPGTALTARVIEEATGRGCREYDLLRGDEAYKARWGTEVRAQSRVLVTAPRLAARAHTFLLLTKARIASSERIADLADRANGWLQRRRTS